MHEYYDSNMVVYELYEVNFSGMDFMILKIVMHELYVLEIGCNELDKFNVISL